MTWAEEIYRGTQRKPFVTIRRFDPDFTLVRLNPKMPWERNPTTWDDIMTEIGDEKILEDEGTLSTSVVITRHEERITILEKRIVDCLSVSLGLEKLVEGLTENQLMIIKKIRGEE